MKWLTFYLFFVPASIWAQNKSNPVQKASIIINGNNNHIQLNQLALGDNSEITNLQDSLKRCKNENKKLQAAIEKAKTIPRDPDFTQALDSANEKLKENDNNGYQLVLETFNTNKAANTQEDIAEVNYLLAWNSAACFHFPTAIKQINDALKYKSSDLRYLLLKARIFNCYGAEPDSVIIAYQAILSRTKNDTLISESYNKIGNAFQLKEEYDSALNYLLNELSIRKKILKNDRYIAISYNNIATAYAGKSDYANMAYYFKLAIDNIKNIDEPGHALYIYDNAIALLETADRYDLAINYRKMELDLYKSLPIKGEHYASLSDALGISYMLKGDYRNALLSFETALYVQRKTPSPYWEAVLRNHLGLAYSYNGIYATAITCIDSSLIDLQKLGDKAVIETESCYTDLSVVYCQKGDYSKGIDYLQQALQLQTSSTLNKYNVATAYYKGGNELQKPIVCLQGFYDKSLRYNSDIFLLWHVYTYTPLSSPAFLCNNIGMALNKTGNHKLALKYLDIAVKISKNTFGETAPLTQMISNNIKTLPQ